VIKLGASPDSIIFANTCKQLDHIKVARNSGVKLLTVDSVQEIQRIHSVYPEAELVLRISVEDTDAPCPVSGMKFGAPKKTWNEILDVSQSLNVNLRGVSFHVGSGGCSFQNYKKALKDSEDLFGLAEAKGMP
jgi:ornithine decarboxylase